MSWVGEKTGVSGQGDEIDGRGYEAGAGNGSNCTSRATRDTWSYLYRIILGLAPALGYTRILHEWSRGAQAHPVYMSIYQNDKSIVPKSNRNLANAYKMIV